MDHTLELVEDVLIVVGGYGNNHHFDDTWEFNISTSRWLKVGCFSGVRMRAYLISSPVLLLTCVRACVLILYNYHNNSYTKTLIP